MWGSIAYGVFFRWSSIVYAVFFRWGSIAYGGTFDIRFCKGICRVSFGAPLRIVSTFGTR